MEMWKFKNERNMLDMSDTFSYSAHQGAIERLVSQTTESSELHLYCRPYSPMPPPIVAAQWNASVSCMHLTLQKISSYIVRKYVVFDDNFSFQPQKNEFIFFSCDELFCSFKCLHSSFDADISLRCLRAFCSIHFSV